MAEEQSVKARDLHVALVSPEIAPFAKTGGLGDVLGSLPQALAELGVRVSLILPAYRSVLLGGFPLEDTGVRFTVPVSDRREEGRLLKTRVGSDITVYFIRADRYFDREYIYGTPEGDYWDNAERFVFFCRAVLEVLKLDPPHILHTNDWESALAIAFLKAQPDLYPELAATKTVLTIHNLGYQGHFWSLDWHLLNLDWSLFTPHYLEFYGKINFLKGGIVFADAVTTVSPTYAEEIQTAEQGFGLDGVFRERAANLVGILNGVD
ncbi:MAG: glycogen/starch synthase, partial [Dehalococcoidales bacterium]|nr:glycogen/starch synthase [Dehalococcoidales bacterium]